MDDLATRTRAALFDRGTRPWLPELTPNLAGTGWARLDREFGLTPSSYATSRLLRGDSEAARNVPQFVRVEGPCDEPSDAILIELIPDDLAKQLLAEGLRFYDAGEIAGPSLSGCIAETLSILNLIPTLSQTVRTLVSSLHLIVPPDDEVDVSFSEPQFPFSVFVSAPQRRLETDALRVAEGLLHEAMHLQLTLIESVVPLVAHSASTHFSPWKKEYRPAHGVLHALYVFRVIDAFLRSPAFGANAPITWQRYADTRCAAIAGQVSEVAEFHRCPDLTPDGAMFVRRLLR